MWVLWPRARAVAVLTLLALVSGCGTPPPSAPAAGPSAATAPAGQDPASDAVTARSLIARFEAASAAGDDATAWSLLASWSRRMFPSVQSFADSRSRFLVAAGYAYVIGEPRRDDPSVPAWLAKSDPGVADPGRVFSVEVTHPDASLAAAGREEFFVALDTAGVWKIWIFV